jgi:ADP-ribose pyrophosphatase YjhB (NUDIX family)
METKRAVAAVVMNNQNVLLGKKIEEPNSLLSGEWHLPGETVEGQETDEEALIRGIMEEAGIEKVEIVKFICSCRTPKGTLVNWYLCSSETTELIAGSDLEEVKWATLEEVLRLSGETAKSLWPEEVKKIFGITD